MADLTATLLAAGNADKDAANRLQEWEQSNLGEFVAGVAAEFATEGKDLRARQLAGLCLKNALNARDDNLQRVKHEAWKLLSAEIRGAVKGALLQTLSSPETIMRATAAQAAAEVAAIELPHQQWPEFVQKLLENVTTAEIDEGIKIASLVCLGYTCERIASIDSLPPMQPAMTDAMLTTIVDGIQKTRPDNIRLAAASALKNSLLFTQSNMEKDDERNAIMNTICEATQSQSEEVRAMAYQCIQQIAYLYYEKLQPYMVTLYELTTKTIREDPSEEVAKQAIEFWSTLCEVEMELIDEELEYQSRGMPIARPCMRYGNAAVEQLVPLLLQAMTKQDEDIDLDGDQYALHVAASTCLTLLSQTVEDLVTPQVLPFVEQHIQNENWHFREAATMAFACILEGASGESIGTVVNQSIPVLMRALNDQNDLVKDTTAFAIAKICELHIRAIPPELLPPLINGLLTKVTTDPPRVAAQSANALNRLGAAFDEDTSGETTGTNALSTYMPNLLQTLMAAADRPDANEQNLRVTSFQAINVFVQNSAPDVKDLLLQLLPAALSRLQSSLTQPALTNEDKQSNQALQGLYCALIQVLVQKLTKEDVMPHGDTIMQNLLQVLQTRNSTSSADSFSAISALADLVGPDFEKYMAALQPFLVAGLRQFDAYQVCSIAVGLVGDIARGIEGKIDPFTKEIMEALVDSLKDTTLHRSVKPTVLSCFGDIAMALGARFEQYLQFSMMLLLQASATEAPEHDEEMVDYVVTLRESVLEAYTGIVQGLNDGGRMDLFIPYFDSVMQFLQRIAADPTRDASLLNKAVGLVGDVAFSMGVNAKTQLGQPFVMQLLQEAGSTGDQSAMETANWAHSLVQQLQTA